VKLRLGLVSNSSSTAFVVTNTTDEVKTVLDFVNEVPFLVADYNEKYGSNETVEALQECAGTDKRKLPPRRSAVWVFGDEERTPLGRVFDYMLRRGGRSQSFKWQFLESLR